MRSLKKYEKSKEMKKLSSAQATVQTAKFTYIKDKAKPKVKI